MSEPTNPTESERKKRERSPSYPAISLRAALDLARKFWDTDKRQWVFASRVSINLGFTPKSSGGLLALAALKKFGLIEDEGVNEGRRLKLSERAISMLNPGNPERDKLLKEAALRPPIYAELWERFGPDGASEGTIKDFLMFEKKFFEPAANTLIATYKDTIAFAKITVSDKSPETDNDFAGEFDETPQATMPAPQSQIQPSQILGSHLPSIDTSKVIVHPTNVTKQFTFPLDDENEVELRFLGTKFDPELLNELDAVIKFLKGRFKVASPSRSEPPQDLSSMQ